MICFCYILNVGLEKEMQTLAETTLYKHSNSQDLVYTS